MGQAIAERTDYTDGKLRQLANRAKDRGARRDGFWQSRRSITAAYLEHAHRPTLENHVHRSPRLDSRWSLNLRLRINPNS
jgi:hypothetical protein